MATLPDASGVIRVDCKLFIGIDANCLTRFFIHYDGSAPSASDLTTLAGAIRTAFNTNLKALVFSSNQLTQVTCTDLTTVSGAVGVDSTAVTGTRAGSALPASASTVVSYKISRRFRGGHARGYWPFGVAGDMSGEQNWGSTFTSSVKTGIDAFFTAVLAAGWSGAGAVTHVNVSYYHGSHVVTNPATGRARNVPDLRATPLVGQVIARNVVAGIGSQRRRLHA